MLDVDYCFCAGYASQFQWSKHHLNSTCSTGDVAPEGVAEFCTNTKGIIQCLCVDCRPKKAVEGLLRHLQNKWEKVAAQLGSSYELHLVGLPSAHQDACLCWKSRSVSSLLTVGILQCMAMHLVWPQHLPCFQFGATI